MFDRYKQLDENNESDDSCNEEEADYEIYSQDDDKQLYNEKNKREKKNAKRTSKKTVEFSSEPLVLAINSKRKFYYAFSFKWSDQRGAQDCFGFDEDVQTRFVGELSNWLDKFTEGLDLNKKCVETWPRLS